MRRASVLAMAAMTVFTAFSVSDAVSASTSTNHLSKLASGESTSIAAQLVQVRGYTYVDISKAEMSVYVAKWKPLLGDYVQAISYHSVVALDPSQNTATTRSGGRETGFLQLVEWFPNSAPPAGQETMFTRTVFSGNTGTTAKELPALTISGQRVLVYENESHPDSRFTYLWYRHGVVAAFDGATRPATEKWLRAYLAQKVLDPGETSALSKRLVAVPGYAYVNAVSDQLVRELVQVPLGPRAYSFHAVLDSKQALGAILLAEVTRTQTLSAYVGRLKSGVFKGFNSMSTKLRGHVVWLFASAKKDEAATVTIENGFAIVLWYPSVKAASLKSSTGFLFSFL